MEHLSVTILELVSVIAARKQLKEPIKIPRPSEAKTGRAAQGGQGPARDLDGAFKQGINVLATTSKQVGR